MELLAEIDTSFVDEAVYELEPDIERVALGEILLVEETEPVLVDERDLVVVGEEVPDLVVKPDFVPVADVVEDLVCLEETVEL